VRRLLLNEPPLNLVNRQHIVGPRFALER
jgi:hypothetical protein